MQPIFRQETTAGSSTAQQLTEDDISRDTQMQVGGPFEIKFDIGDKVMLSTFHQQRDFKAGDKNRVTKFMPHFDGHTC